MRLTKTRTGYFFLPFLFMNACSNAPELPEEPNFVFIIADDLGYHDLGFMGSDYYETPVLDSLAREAMVFTDGYAACAVCSPSRASIMTGMFPDKHGITDYIGAPMGEEWNTPFWGEARGTQMLPASYKTHLPHEEIVLPEAMKQAGYRTFFAGKWHLGGEGSFPEDHGFDINKGGNHRGGPYGGGYYSPYGNPQLKDGEDGESLTLRLAEETANFIRHNKDEKFFAYLSFYTVHAPLQTTKEYWSIYREKAVDLGLADHGYEMEKRFPIRVVQDNPVYAGMVKTMDEAVGIVMNTLQEEGLTQNTVVVFTSDNGGVASGDDYATALLPLSGGKGYQWEGGIRVPLLVQVPWLESKGIENSTPVSGVDFYPTFLDLAGLDAPAGTPMDGVSILPVLKGEEMEERPLFWHYPHYGNQGGDPSGIVRKGKWKLIRYYEDGTRELYDLENDKEENNDLAERYPQIVEELDNLLMERLKSTQAEFPTPNPIYDSLLWAEKIERRRTVLMPRLEQQRINMLQPDWNPPTDRDNDWWGTQPGSE